MKVVIAICTLFVLTSTVASLGVLSPSDSAFSLEFGCAVASSYPVAGVFAPALPEADGENAWRLYLYSQNANKEWSAAGEVKSDVLSQPVPSRPFPTCAVSMYDDYVAIGEPWYNMNQGRVTLIKRGTTNQILLSSQGSDNGEKLGSSLSLFDTWFAASSPSQSAYGLSWGPYVNLYRWNAHFEVDIAQNYFRDQCR